MMIVLITMFSDTVFRYCKIDKAADLALLVYYFLTFFFGLSMLTAGVDH